MALSPSWVSAIEAFGRAQRRAGIASTSIGTRTSHLRHLARRVDVEPFDVTAEQLLDYVDAHPTWELETRRSRRATLRRFYAWAHGEGHVGSDPALVLPAVKASTRRGRPIPMDVYDAAYATASAREKLMLRLALDAGMRRAEIAVVHSRDVFQDLDGWSLLVHGKGRRERVVPLSRRLALELRALPDGYAFPGDDDGHLSPRWVGKLVNRLLDGDWTIHKVRHRAGTRVHRAVGGDILVTMRFLGHASPVTTQTYVAEDDPALRRGVEDAAAS